VSAEWCEWVCALRLGAAFLFVHVGAVEWCVCLIACLAAPSGGVRAEWSGVVWVGARGRVRLCLAGPAGDVCACARPRPPLPLTLVPAPRVRSVVRLVSRARAFRDPSH
jgi:hypothetical protein